MNRFFFFALLIGAALLALPTDAYAHGGQYRVPGGGVDPGLREPTDPTPPPPPPPSAPPTTPAPTPSPTPTPPTTPPSTPPTTPPPSQPTPGTMPTGERGKQAGLSYDNWVFWYAYNNAEIENLKEAIYPGADTSSALAQMGSGAGNKGAETQDIRTKIKSHIIPLFLWAMDPANAKHDDVESAAYIGLAKVATEPQHIELILKGLDAKRNKIITESAALAIGLLRREQAVDQFSATDLNKVRDFLFDMYRDEKRQIRERCFAAFGLGLLGDQPAGEGTSSVEGHAEVTRRLFALLEEDYPDDLTVAALLAIGMQEPDSIDKDQRQILRDVVTKGKLGKRSAKQLIPAYAAAALGKIGDNVDVSILRRALTSRRSNNFLQSSAAIGLGQLANKLQSSERVDLVKGLLSNIKRIKVQQAVNFSLISLAYIVNADVDQTRTDVLSDTKVGDYLLKVAADGKPMEKPYAALALGLVCRKIGDNPEAEAYGEFRHKALMVLREGIASKKLAPRDQSAFCIAVGMAQDAQSIKALREIVQDRKSNREKAGYSALALGLIPARGNQGVLDAVRSTLKRTNDEELKIRCATALGLLRDNTAVDMLLDELRAAKNQSLKGQLGLAIAKIGDGRAVPDMVDMIRDKNEKYLSRAILTASLGVIGDLEWIPSLNRISKNVNYRALNDSLREVLSIL